MARDHEPGFVFDQRPPLLREDLLYDAMITDIRQTTPFGGARIEFLFTLLGPGPGFNVSLPGYCTGQLNKRIQPASKLASWCRALCDFTGKSPSRITLSMFKQFRYRVTIRTVAKTQQQKTLHPRDVYQVVDDILAVISEPTSDDAAGQHDDEIS